MSGPGFSGTVMDPTGAPLAGASISSVPRVTRYTKLFAGSARTRSAKDGSFTLLVPPDPNLEIVASHANWALSAPERFEIVAGTERTDVELHLRVGGTITGIVYDGSGEAYEGAYLSVGSLRHFSHGGGTTQEVRTDSSGRFRVERVPPEEITIFATNHRGGLLARKVVSLAPREVLEVALGKKP